MSEFKRGDRVVYTAEGRLKTQSYKGRTGTVLDEYGSNESRIEWDNGATSWHFNDNLKKIDPKPVTETAALRRQAAQYDKAAEIYSQMAIALRMAANAADDFTNVFNNN